MDGRRGGRDGARGVVGNRLDRGYLARMRWGLLVALLVVLVSTTAQASTSATCTASEKAARAAAANAYAKKIPAARKAYFKTHRSAAQRKAFVAKQRKKLAKLRAAAACTVPAPPEPPAATPPSTLTILPDVPADRAEIARTGYQIALGYLPKIGAPADWHADVLIAGTPDDVVAAVAKTGGSTDFIHQVMADGGGAFAGPGRVYVVPAGTSYDSMRYERRVLIVVHEMWHTVQYALMHGAQDPGPTWLREGSAEYVGYSAVLDAGIEASSVRRDTIWAVQHDFASVPLESSTGSAAYNEGFLATERLVALKGIGSLVAYWTAIGNGTPWETAFQTTFGMSTQQFYADFASYRQSV